MKESIFPKYFPIFALVAIGIYYLPILFPSGSFVVFFDKVYLIINPFITMPVIIGLVSVFVLRGDFKKVYKIIFIVLYAIVTLITLFTLFLVFGTKNSMILLLVVPHLFLTISHSREAKILRKKRDDSIDDMLKKEGRNNRRKNL